MTDRNEMKLSAELVVGNPTAHTTGEVALAGMLLELLESPVRFNEYDGTSRTVRLDGGDPDAGIEPSYVVDEAEEDAFKRINLRVVELEFAQAQCKRWHTPPSAPPVVDMDTSAYRISDSYWLDRDNNKHAIGCPGCAGGCRGNR